MEDIFQTRVLLHTSDVKKEADVDQQEALCLQIKEEEEELCVSREGEQLRVKEETDGRFPSTAASVSSKAMLKKSRQKNRILTWILST
ncbi:uncharacterized protein LOC122827077 isoform X2 [Gambusia affinis]|uniref:uncharacterized protein LOC122827077 isoform X2 n=1 Tax=Gambusia affinis TaxID=33528 RepID=UPI001CDD496B|nr:uncharacterized protein LOC122827077 isoform X2 [Gambusia affinis]